MKENQPTLYADLKETFCTVPVIVADALAEERKRVGSLQDEVNEVAEWLQQREQAATIAGLYGN